ncbi:MAG: NADP-dependent 3-hydroxy acid dehydrogenase YdfG [Pseudomonas sp.]|nr:MAG: NADP-dependent 3-hydroxy acid dehydrogenase YdfG [Pseudomonas sp.]
MSTSHIALITGASSGIGAVYADRLAARGYDLILVARREDRLQALAADITRTHGRQVHIVVADLVNPDDLARVEHLLASNPAISVLVNNAGLARLHALAQSTVADSLTQITLNITALTRLTHAALPGMLARNAGTIINVASILGLHALPVSAVYSGTKSFVLTFSRGLQTELAGTGVKVQAVLPSATATEIWDASGIPLSALEQEKVMTTEHLVDAALAGLDQGESITLPSVADAELWTTYDTARVALFAATQTGKPAPRYGLA